MRECAAFCWPLQTGRKGVPRRSAPASAAPRVAAGPPAESKTEIRYLQVIHYYRIINSVLLKASISSTVHALAASICYVFELSLRQ